MPAWGQVGVTFIIVLFGWVLFRAPDLGQAMHYWATMAGFGPSGVSSAMLSAQIINPHNVFGMLLCALVAFQPIQAHHWVDKLTPTKLVVCAAVFLLAVSMMFTQTYNPFLYFQF
jgi:alginate O-acetyltransferase complex protein AlgI